MILVDFVYDKKNGETPRRRFVAVARNDQGDIYLSGYELTSNGVALYKDFLKSRIVGNIHSYGNFDESALRAANLTTVDAIFDMLGWTIDMQSVYHELGGGEARLCQLASDKLGNKVVPLRDNLFLLLGNAEVVMNIVNGFDLFTMRVTPGVVEFYQDKTKLTTDEFTKRLLGV